MSSYALILFILSDSDNNEKSFQNMYPKYVFGYTNTDTRMYIHKRTHTNSQNPHMHTNTHTHRFL